MKKNVAVLQFPGINSEYETRRALWDAGMDSEFFRWNDSPSKLREFDGYVIAGGFSYEDRGRAGLIASLDPIMGVLKEEAAKGKPILGICNGAQILVESGLVPGGEKNQLLMCLAKNKKVKNGEIFGTGFYNENVYVKSVSGRARSAFTIDFEEGEISRVPVAHGEGRFTSSIDGLFDELESKGQIVFKYCTADGAENSDFPVNPNGAMHDSAGICNGQGNVLAIMPHPERAPIAAMPRIFTSMRKYMEGEALSGTSGFLTFNEGRPATRSYSHEKNSVELYVKLIITDNEAQTIENTLRQHAFKVKLEKWTHFQVDHTADLDQDVLAENLVASGELLNTNKETVKIVTDEVGEAGFSDGGGGGGWPDGTGGKVYRFLVRDKEDSVGISKLKKIKHHMDADAIKSIRHGVFWEVNFEVDGAGDIDIEALLAVNIFANHHAQVLYEVR